MPVLEGLLQFLVGAVVLFGGLILAFILLALIFGVAWSKLSEKIPANVQKWIGNIATILFIAVWVVALSYLAWRIGGDILNG